MGNLLGAPVTEKETHTGVTDDALPFAVSSMQGWRVHMEDAHITEGRLYAQTMSEDNNNKNNNNNKGVRIDLPGHSLFAVFDGHGGTFSAKYAGDNFCRVLSREPKFVAYAKYRQTADKEKSSFVDPSMRDEYLRNGRDLLHGALIDAFVTIDREIAVALRGNKVPDADTPYQPDSIMHNSPNFSDFYNYDKSKKNPNDGDGSHGGAAATTAAAADTGPSLEEEINSGTTACVVMLTPEYIVCANAGDSRALLARNNREAIPLSHDHKPDNTEEARRIRDGGGFVAGGRVEGDLAVSRGLGDFRFKVMDVVMAAEKIADGAVNYEATSREDGHRTTRGPVTNPSHQKVSPVPELTFVDRLPDKDEFVMIACDGIWDVQTNEVAVQLVANLFAEGESDLGLICEEVCDCCLGIGSKDNMTTLVVKLEAQTIGTGGGVKARRATRQTASSERQEASGMDST